MISKRENILRTLRRRGYDFVPLDFELCESQINAFENRFGHRDYKGWFGQCHRTVEIKGGENYADGFSLFKREKVPPHTEFDVYGIGHSSTPTSFHMTRMHHPLKGAELSEIKDYPYPSVPGDALKIITSEVEKLHKQDLAAYAFSQMTIWEPAWYLRSMEEIMIDMMMEDEKATVLLDSITSYACSKASTYARAGVDILSLGDDIGTQETIMIDEAFWEKWLKPRMKKVIDTARKIKPDILIFYHSCGYILPFIEGLIEIGVDILNPVQPECMDFNEVHELYGNRLSFWGPLGTQQLIPYGTPEEIRQCVKSRIETCGEKGGLVLGPSHLVEPEVPWENLLAISEAVKDFGSKN